MSVAQLIVQGEFQAAQIVRATIVEVEPRSPTVKVRSETTGELLCDVLHNSENVCVLSVGDAALVLLASDNEERGIVLGRIGPSHSAHQELLESASDELVIEAKKNLTLKCGEGSITIREDGKILIKGKDLVSHAQRMNRIKGGSVSIN